MRHSSRSLNGRTGLPGLTASIAAAPLAVATRVQTRVLERVERSGDDTGMTTAEYAVGTVAACGFSTVLYKVISSPQVLDIVKGLIGRALKLSF